MSEPNRAVAVMFAAPVALAVEVPIVVLGLVLPPLLFDDPASLLGVDVADQHPGLEQLHRLLIKFELYDPFLLIS